MMTTVSFVKSISINSDDVFNQFENDRAKWLLAGKVTTAGIYYEASAEHPVYLDRVNSVTGERQTGLFERGEFRSL
jgi:hypothetical protein